MRNAKEAVAMERPGKNFWIVWAVVSVASFVLFLSGITLLLGNPIVPQNFTAILIVSFLFGMLASTLYLLKRKIVFFLFLVGLTVGFFEMSRLFLINTDGWGDLTGTASLFTWAAIGLASGGVAELCRFLYKKISGRM
jgi:hypothetical protein